LGPGTALQASQSLPKLADRRPGEPRASRTRADLRSGIRWICLVSAAALLVAAPGLLSADDPEDGTAAPSLEDTLEAGEASVEEPRRQLVSWNELDWYLSDNVRLEFAYGYGTLDRFGLEGTTQFFQSRIQLLF